MTGNGPGKLPRLASCSLATALTSDASTSTATAPASRQASETSSMAMASSAVGLGSHRCTISGVRVDLSALASGLLVTIAAHDSATRNKIIIARIIAMREKTEICLRWDKVNHSQIKVQIGCVNIILYCTFFSADTRLSSEGIRCTDASQLRQHPTSSQHLAMTSSHFILKATVGMLCCALAPVYCVYTLHRGEKAGTLNHSGVRSRLESEKSR